MQQSFQLFSLITRQKRGDELRHSSAELAAQHIREQRQAQEIYTKNLISCQYLNPTGYEVVFFESYTTLTALTKRGRQIRLTKICVLIHYHIVTA